jgi:DNA (cytosine-5)-methyltransferase 1
VPLSKDKPRLLDLFSGAGGCTKGYQDAGFYVVGVDKEPQPNYVGDQFIQADALDVLRWFTEGDQSGRTVAGGFDAIHASPPCPRYSAGSKNWNGRPEDHPDLIEPVRKLLEATGLPYVIENVPGSPLKNPIQICGSGLRLRVRRHRLFEVNFPLMGIPCSHGWQRSNTNRIRSGYQVPEDSVVPVYGGGQAGFDVATCREAMGISWMTTDELNNAIPPAYCRHVGEALLAHLQAESKVAA